MGARLRRWRMVAAELVLYIALVLLLALMFCGCGVPDCRTRCGVNYFEGRADCQAVQAGEDTELAVVDQVRRLVIVGYTQFTPRSTGDRITWVTLGAPWTAAEACTAWRGLEVRVTGTNWCGDGGYQVEIPTPADLQVGLLSSLDDCLWRGE